MKIKKKRWKLYIFLKTANRSSLFDQEKRKKGTLFGRFLKHSKNAKIKKKDKGRERERETTRSHAREKERECTNQTK